MGEALGRRLEGRPRLARQSEAPERCQPFGPAGGHRSAAGLRGVRFVTLRKGLTEAETGLLSKHPGIAVLDGEREKLDDTAAVISVLDAVITVDSALAHLAGALGKPVWVMLAFRPEWRWMLGRSDSPWYPSARLFRQRSRGDWAGVVERLAAELRRLGVARKAGQQHAI